MKARAQEASAAGGDDEQRAASRARTRLQQLATAIFGDDDAKFGRHLPAAAGAHKAIINRRHNRGRSGDGFCADFVSVLDI